MVPSLDLVHRVVDIDVAYTIARMRVLERIPGNPMGIAYRSDGNVTALMARRVPSPAFNRIVGLRQGQADCIAPLLDWYREHEVTCRIEIAAGDDEPATSREIVRLGLCQSAFHAALVCEPDRTIKVPDDCVIERVTTAEAMDAFLTAYVAGWSIPDDWREQFKANVRPWLHEPDWSLYAARADGLPAAAAILFVQNGLGYLADSATDPAFRGRGLHTALLRRRILDASLAGVDFICSGADFLSNSHRNMERVGMKLLFLRAIWVEE
jgi:ribosomal protein S18 acetylase RimI-like enzyme